ncbi:MAG: glycosyltransferase, partial [Acidobacteria bacterium]
HTREIGQRRGAKLVQVRPEDFTFGHSLNEGIRHSSGRFIAIVSAHTRPLSSHWLKELVAPLRDDKTAMVYGMQRGVAESKYGELRDFERTFGLEPRALAPPQFFANNANSGIRRDLWERQPFDETLPGLEDIAWAKYWMERGYKVAYQPTAGIAHIHDETWPQVRRRYYREGQAAKWIGVKSRRNLPAEVWSEARAFGGDLLAAAREGALGRRAAEIARFRYEKLMGTATGVWSGALMENPTTRASMLFSKAHKAVVIHSAGHASLDDVPTPAPRPSEVLVRVAFVGVCATDLEILDGELGYYKKGEAKYPIVPGHEFSGTIASVGSRVTDLKPGDRVVVECIQSCGECEACRRGNPIGCASRAEVGVIRRDGGSQEYMITPARFVHRIPAELTLRDACLCEPIAVVLKGLRRLRRACAAGAEPQRIAVVGGGPIGHLSARVLTSRGHAVTVFDRSPARLALFDGSGIATASDLNELAAFDAVVEATGDPDALTAILERSSPGSVLLLLGLPYARRDFSFETIVGYDKTVVGSVGSAAEDFEEAVATLPSVDVSAFRRAVLTLPEFAAAWELARARTHLKVMIQVDPSLPT